MVGAAQSFFVPQPRSPIVLLYKTGIYDIFIKYIPGDTLYTKSFFYCEAVLEETSYRDHYHASDDRDRHMHAFRL